jgi:exonuclease VII small subunit
VVNLEQIDQWLADWKKKIDIVSQNLIDLHGLPTYHRLTGVSGFPKIELTGVTQARVTPALEAMSNLFQHFDLLVTTIGKAVELRKQVPRFLGSEQKIREIEAILTGTSIQLAVVQIPLAQRGLLSAATTANAIAPNELLAAMTNAFQVARDAVVAVDEAWLRLEPNLAAAEAEIISLQKLANSLGQGSSSELVIARQKIAAISTSIESDPLGVSADFDREIQPLIARVRASLEELVKQLHQIRDNLETAHELLKQLVELNRQATESFAESQEKVIDHSTLQTPLAQEQIDALSQWLTRLETKFAEGIVNPVRVGLENWTAKVKEYIAAEERAYTANRAPLETRQELRGRLDALKAKALARGLAEDAILTELAQNAKQLLYTRPTPLDQAAELVSQYEKRLNSQLHR